MSPLNVSTDSMALGMAFSEFPLFFLHDISDRDEIQMPVIRTANSWFLFFINSDAIMINGKTVQILGRIRKFWNRKM
jgi:hypothetical protein